DHVQVYDRPSIGRDGLQCLDEMRAPECADADIDSDGRGLTHCPHVPGRPCKVRPLAPNRMDDSSSGRQSLIFVLNTISAPTYLPSGQFVTIVHIGGTFRASEVFNHL